MQETYSVPPLVLDADLVAAIAAQWPEPPARTRGRAQTYDQAGTRIIRPEAIYDFSRSTTSALQLDLGPQAVSHVGQSFPSIVLRAHIPGVASQGNPKSIGPFDNIPQPPPCGSPVIPDLNDLHRRPASHERRAPVVVHPSLSPLNLFTTALRAEDMVDLHRNGQRLFQRVRHRRPSLVLQCFLIRFQLAGHIMFRL
ncbi:hypothetical protein A0H81_11165 [Grifola frondosa]|uniref:Uncharacterized protein n=1 Tax=Grifola frondosa TaxID=5627 RepID=A0A1C7LXP0_GRIFR|nr:hypothetical protein A0H81_11165 [Grifola frondosa]